MSRLDNLQRPIHEKEKWLCLQCGGWGQIVSLVCIFVYFLEILGIICYISICFDIFFNIELFKIINKFELKLHIGSDSKIYENLKPVNRSTSPVRIGSGRISRPKCDHRFWRAFVRLLGISCTGFWAMDFKGDKM